MFIFIALLIVVGLIAVAGFFGYKQFRKLHDNMNVMFHRQTQACTMADVDQEVEKRVKTEVDKAMNLERRRLQEMQETYVDMIETLRAGERGVSTGRPAPSRTTDAAAPPPHPPPSSSPKCPFSTKDGGMPKTRPHVTRGMREMLQTDVRGKDDSDGSSGSSSSAKKKKKKERKKEKEKKKALRRKCKAEKDKKTRAAQDREDIDHLKHLEEGKEEESAAQSEVEAPELLPTPSSSAGRKRARGEPASDSMSDIDDVIVQTMSDVSMSDLIVGGGVTSS